MSSDTYKRLVLDAGQIRIGYVDEDNPGALLGATRGGSVFEVAGDLRDMPADGAKGAVKGSERVTRVTASLSVTVIEFVSWILRMALPGSQRANWPTVTPTHDEIGRYLTLALSAYNDTVALIAEVNETSEPVVLILKNVVGKGGLTASLAEGDEAGIKLKLEAHFDPAEVAEEPWVVRNPIEIVPPPTEAIPFWKGENNTIPEEGISDFVGRNAIWSGTPAYEEGYVGRCFAISGNDFLSISLDGYGFTPYGSFNFEFYFKNVGEVSNAIAGIIAESSVFSIAFVNNSGVELDDGINYLTFEYPFEEDVWYYVKLQYNNGEWLIKVNDIILEPQSLPINVGAINLLLSTNGGEASVLFDEVRINTDILEVSYELVAHFAGENNRLDSLGNCLMIGMNNYTTGVIGNAFKLDDENWFVQIQYSNFIKFFPDLNFAIEFYVKVKDIYLGWIGIECSTGYTGYNFTVLIDYEKIQIEVVHTSQNPALTITMTFPLSSPFTALTWYKIKIAYFCGRWVVFINGVLFAISNVIAKINTDREYYLAFHAVYDQYVLYDEIKIYNTIEI